MRNRTTTGRRKRYGQRIDRFHLFDFNTNQWHRNIVDSPILLTHAQVLNWNSFRYNQLQYNQLYLWQANEWDWVPLYATNEGFLMIEQHYMSYDDVSYDQFQEDDWKWQNKVSIERIKIILRKFNISFNSINNVGLPSHQIMAKNPFVSGQHFYGSVVKNKQTSFFNIGRHDWQRYCWFNHTNRKWSYAFIRGFVHTYHQQTSDPVKQADNIKVAATKAQLHQIIIYHEQQYYIPFSKETENSIKLNNHEIINIENLDEKLESNANIIGPLTRNSMTIQDVKLIEQYKSNLFIDNRNASYTWQFQYHFQASVPKSAWTVENAFEKLFAGYQIDDTFLILDEGGFDGVPIGLVSYNQKTIGLSDSTVMTWDEFTEKLNNNEIMTSINLDFCGQSAFFNKERINPQFTGSNQLISLMDINEASQSSINSAFVGQYILIDYGAAFFLPVYILSPNLIRTNNFIVQLSDILSFVLNTANHNTDIIYKTSIKINNKFVQIMNDPCTLESNNIQQNQNLLPSLNSIPLSPITGLSQKTSKIVTQASQNAQDHRSDMQQFRQFGKNNPQTMAKMTKHGKSVSTNNNNNSTNKKSKNCNRNNSKHSKQQPTKNKQNTPNTEEKENDITIETKRGDETYDFVPAPAPYENHSNFDICQQIDILSTMSYNQKSEYIHKCLYHNFAMLYDEKILLERFDQFMQYSDYEIATALGDNTVFVSMISKMEHRLRQLRMAYNDEIPSHIWFEDDSDVVKHNPKAEIKEEDGKECKLTVQLISEKLHEIDDGCTRKRLLANILYPKLYSMEQIEDKIKVLASLLVLEDKVLVGLCVDNHQLCIRALLVQEAISVYDIDPIAQQESIAKIEAPVESSLQKQNDTNNNNDNKNDNNDNNNENNENDLDMTKETTDEKEEVNIVNPLNKVLPSVLNQINLFKARNNKQFEDKRKRISIDNIIKHDKHVKTNNLSKFDSLLINSWSDKTYSHLRAFQWYPPRFSDRESIYDHASQKSTLMENDDQFVTKDIITHVARRSFHNPNDYYIIRLSSNSIDDTNGKHDQFFKFKHCAEEIQGIYDFVDKKDFITQQYRLSDSDFTEMNATTRYNAQHSKWAFEHKKYQHNYNHPKHPGMEPQWVPPCSRSILKQREDRDGNIFSVSINDRHELRPMKNGNVFFDERVNETRYVDFLFHPNAAFAGCANWKNEMETQFERWQEWRRDLNQQQKLEWDEEMELPLDTKIRIIKPKTRCTLAMNIPMSKLRDHGDSVTMYKEITNIFKHYNYSQRKKENAILIPIESIRTISRGFKDRNWMVKKTDDWRRWLNKNSEYFKKCNPKKQLQLKQKIYYDHIYTNTIYVEFNT